MEQVNYTMEIYFPNGDGKKLQSNQILMNLRIGDKFIYKLNSYVVSDRKIEYFDGGDIKEIITLT